MNKKVKELLLIVKGWHENGALVLSIHDIENLLIEKYGFDVARNVKPKISYLKGRGILRVENAKAATFSINLALLGNLLQDDVLIEAGREQAERMVKNAAGLEE